MSKEFRVVGVPGAGKTTFLCEEAAVALASIAERSTDAFDAPGGIVFSSLTRAAAATLAARGVEVPEDAIGTLHAHAWRSLGRPPLCVDGKPLKQWNEECTPNYQIRGGRQSVDQLMESGERASMGDALLAEYHLLRSRLTPRERWRTTIADFAAEYESWKRISGFVDFSDVIHDAWEKVPEAPGGPSQLYVDEGQDHDQAEFRLIRRWAEAPTCERLVVVGDPDQCLYSFRGADPDAFYGSKSPSLSPLGAMEDGSKTFPIQGERILSQSWRVPSLVHAAAMRIIQRVHGRRPVEYSPRADDGRPNRLHDWSAFTRFSSRYVDDLVSRAVDLAAGRSLMFLASCEYQLKPLCGELRRRGIPFHNPYAKERGSFNPLGAAGRSTASRVLDYLRPSVEAWGDEAAVWTPAQLWSWVEMTNGKGWLKHGAKKEIERLSESSDQWPVTVDQLAAWCGGTIPPEMAEQSLAWLRSVASEPKRGMLEFAHAIVRRGGAAALKAKPSVIVGTVHSVKGGEAQVVVLCPDLSTQGWDQLERGGNDAAAVWRCFYVGLTRASEEVVLCGASGPMAIPW